MPFLLYQKNTEEKALRAEKGLDRTAVEYPYLYDHLQLKPAVGQIEVANGSVLLTEGRNRLHTQSVTIFLGKGQAFAVKRDAA